MDAITYETEIESAVEDRDRLERVEQAVEHDESLDPYDRERLLGRIDTYTGGLDAAERAAELATTDEEVMKDGIQASP